MRALAAYIILGVIAQGCEPAATQFPPGAAQTQSGNANPQQAQIDKDRRWSHAVESAQKAAFLGGIFGGPFGAPASMVMGALGFGYGMLTADSKIAEESAQAKARYQKEAEKDRALESAIEQEIERQRALENQIAGLGGAPAVQPPRVPQEAYQPAPPAPPVAAPKPAPTASTQAGTVTVARASTPPAPPPFRNVEMRDINNDGVPDIWIYYNPQKPGEVLRQEESTKSDGRVDAWSYFKDGQLVRRDVDRQGSGRPDTIYYYENDKIMREERDEIGQGRMTYRASYRNGRLEKVERDTSGQGRPDLWLFYDTSRDGDVVLREEKDLNGDGHADLWSYYDNGRLVRRDVNAPGLEILSKQDQVPTSIAEFRAPPVPGS